MSRKVATHRRYGAIAELAARQHGVVSAAQLYSLGLSEDQVRTRVQSGWLHRLHRGVYAVGRAMLPVEGHWMAAVLACGRAAVLSHTSAAQLWAIRKRPRHEHPAGEGATLRGPVHISVPDDAGRMKRPGVIVHRVAALLPGECTIQRGIPVTRTSRTIFDLATQLPRRQLERAADEADRLGLCTEEDLDEIVRLHAAQPGTGALRQLLEEHRAGSTATRNDFEERFLALCRKHRLPQPDVNVPLLDFVVDFVWREASLVVEVDGRRTHATRRAFQADRDRDGRLAVAGYRVVRFTWWDVTRRPAVVADRVRRLIGVGGEKPGT
jgi:very-short-patch-repair endonuclease